MQVAPTRNTRRRLVNAILPYTPAMLNAGSRLVRQLWDMNTMRQALPPIQPQSSQNPPQNRRRRRNRRRARGVGPSTFTPSGEIRVNDTESFSPSSTNLDYKTFPFQNLERMKAFRQLYGKFMIHSVTIKAQGLAGSATVGTIAYGVLVDGHSSAVNVDNLSTLRPYRTHHASKSSSIKLTHDIQLSKWMDSDTAAFTLYWKASATGVVSFQVSYDVSFASPRPT